MTRIEQSDFDLLIAQVKAQSPPLLPGSFQADVLREIRLRTAAAPVTFSLFDFQPRAAALVYSLALTLLIGFAIPWLAVSKPEAPSDFLVFSSDYHSAPSKLLASSGTP